MENSEQNISSKPQQIKYISPFILITTFVLTAVLFGIGGYIAGKRLTPQMPVTAMPTPTAVVAQSIQRQILSPTRYTLPTPTDVAMPAGWKPYQDTTDGYSIDLPPDAKIIDTNHFVLPEIGNGSNADGVTIVIPAPQSINDALFYFQENNGLRMGGGDVSFAFLPQFPGSYGANKFSREVFASGKTGYSYEILYVMNKETSWTVPPGRSAMLDFSMGVFGEGDTSDDGGKSKALAAKNDQLFDQIVSTFHFLPKK